MNTQKLMRAEIKWFDLVREEGLIGILGSDITIPFNINQIANSRSLRGKRLIASRLSRGFKVGFCEENEKIVIFGVSRE